MISAPSAPTCRSRSSAIGRGPRASRWWPSVSSPAAWSLAGDAAHLFTPNVTLFDPAIVSRVVARRGHWSRPRARQPLRARRAGDCLVRSQSAGLDRRQLRSERALHARERGRTSDLRRPERDRSADRRRVDRRHARRAGIPARVEAASDLRLRARQFNVNLKPVTANPRLKWELTYTLLDAREKF